MFLSKRKTSTPAIVSLFLTGVLIACGGGGTQGATSNRPAPAVSISIAPVSTNMATGSSTTFSATVLNSTNTSVTWSVEEGVAGGSVAQSGVYTAPTTPGTYHIIATSHADTTKTAKATVSVFVPISISITPASARVTTGATTLFSATVLNTAKTSVTWSVEEGALGGSITPGGVYTAPATPGIFYVIATSDADTTKSAKASVAVIVPPPAFNSKAPVDAEEGVPYSYSVSTTDPNGGVVALELTTAPAGATLISNVLTWTPTPEQSRKSNGFVITATTERGGIATQEWSIVPRGTVKGQMAYRYLSATGVDVQWLNLTSVRCAAYSRGIGDELIRHDAITFSDGKFRIPGVPGGYYWLVLESWDPSWSWNPIWTDTGFIDLSNALAGRRDRVRHASRERQFDVSGLNPWLAADWLRWSIPNIAVSTVWTNVDAGTTNFTSYQLDEYEADANKGDRGYLTQMTSGTAGAFSYRSVSKVLGPLEISDADSGAATVAGTLMNVPQAKSLRANIAVSEFAKPILDHYPDAWSGYPVISVNVHPFGFGEGDLGEDFRTQLLQLTTNSSRTDVDLGDISYGNPYPPTWPEYVEYVNDIGVGYEVPGTIYGAAFGGKVRQLAEKFPTATEALRPLLKPLTNVRIDGQDFFGTPYISTSPTLSWTVPESGRPNGYLITVFELTSLPEGARAEWVQSFSTAGTSVWFPQGVFQVGHMYVILMDAVFEGGRDLGSTPYLTGFPRASSPYFSGILRVPGSASPAATTDNVPSALVSGSKIKRQSYEDQLRP